MCNNLLIFRIYLLLSMTILLPICYFITSSLIQKIRVYFLLKSNKDLLTLHQLSYGQISLIFKYYIKQKQWLSCILMLEFYSLYTSSQIDNFLGICYQKLDCYIIARYYYLRALSNDCNNLRILQNLLLISKILNDDKMMTQVVNKINTIKEV